MYARYGCEKSAITRPSTCGREGGTIRAPALPLPTAGPDTIHLRIMATSDLHMHLRGYDYLADRPTASSGLSRMATLMRDLRRTSPNTLLFDNGDLLQGTPMGDVFAERRAPHPAIAAMQALGLDAATLGNHDFDFGLETLARILAQAHHPTVSANVALAPGAEGPKLPPFALLERRFRDGAGRPHLLRIGVIGFLPPQVMRWNAHVLCGRMQVRDILDAARAEVPRLRAAGADVVIALCHSGIGGAEAVAGMENAAVPLAALPGIDALVAGHSHRVFPGPDHAASGAVDPLGGRIHGKPATMPGCNGSHLGLLDLVLGRRDGVWHVLDGRGGALALSAAAYAEDPAIIARTERAHAETLAHVQRQSGQTGRALHSHFALLGHAPALSVVLAAQTRHAARVLAGGPHADLPLLSAAAPLRNGGRGTDPGVTDIPAGPILRRHVAALYGFPNRLTALLLDGAALREWLERAAAIFNRITPGSRDMPLLMPDAPGYHFDVIDGVSYAIDLSRAARYTADGEPVQDITGPGRITRLSYGGRPVAPGDRFVILTSSYRAGGGGGFPGLPDAEVLHVSDETVEQIVLEGFERGLVPEIRPGPLFRFQPLPGTCAIFETGIAARAYEGEMPWLALTPDGAVPGGRMRYRLEL